MAFTADADRCYRIPKQRCRITNWAEYDSASRQHGSLTIWFTEAASRLGVPSLVPPRVVNCTTCLWRSRRCLSRTCGPSSRYGRDRATACECDAERSPRPCNKRAWSGTWRDMAPNGYRFASVDNSAKSTRNRLRISTAKKWTLWSTPCWTLGAGIQVFQWTLWSESNSQDSNIFK
jgi:hypothetical protein